MVKVLKLKFRRLVNILVEMLKLGFVDILNSKFSRIF